MKTIYSWQNEQWRMLCESVNNSALAHALLLYGNIGLGKHHFAKEFAKYILCGEKNLSNYCDTCDDCILFNAGNHPDFNHITFIEDSEVIKIDQIREVIAKITQTASRTNAKVIIIHPAEAMNQAGANALLKSLEEPTAKVHFILVTNKNSQLPATIRSRCLPIKFSSLTEQQNNLWLKQLNKEISPYLKDFSAQSPLLAKSMIEEQQWQLLENLLQDVHDMMMKTISIVTIAEKWQKHNIKNVISWVLFWVSYIITHHHISIENTSSLTNLITVISKQKSSEQWLNHLDFIYEQQRYLNAKINLNSQMLLESIFLKLL